LRNLGAIHLASALAIRGELSAVCVYDRRLFAAAESSGFTVASPGARLGRNPRLRAEAHAFDAPAKDDGGER
jgi:hypothetical protein